MRADEVARGWYQALEQNAMHIVWAATSPGFRLVITQSVLHRARQGGQQVDDLAAEYAKERPDHPDLAEFMAAARAQLIDATGGVAYSDLAPGTRPRPVGPNLELIVLFHKDDLHDDESGDLTFLPNTSARAVRMVIETAPGDMPRVRGLGSLMEPGWPPTVAIEYPAHE